MAEKMGLVSFDLFVAGRKWRWRAPKAALGKKGQLTRSKGWRLVYTEPCWGVQNGNSSSDRLTWLRIREGGPNGDTSSTVATATGGDVHVHALAAGWDVVWVWMW